MENGVSLNDRVPTLEEFRAWLNQEASEEVVGRVADWVECPLARFFTVFYAVPCEVSRFSYRLVPDLGRAGLPAVLWVPEEKRELPPWAWEFGERLDHAYAFVEKPRRFVLGLPVTQVQALTVLDEMMAGR